MNVKILNQFEKTIFSEEMRLLPRKGDKVEDHNGKVYEVSSVRFDLSGRFVTVRVIELY